MGKAIGRVGTAHCRPAQICSDHGIDCEKELAELEHRAERLRKDIYENLTPFQRVMMARHPKRPTTLDYISMLLDEFDEFHGDRTYRDDGAIVEALAHLKAHQ